MADVASRAVAINPADKSLIVVIALLLWMQRAKDVWLLQLTNGTRVRGSSKTWLRNVTFSIKTRFRILNLLFACSNRWAHLAERVFSAVVELYGCGVAFGSEHACTIDSTSLTAPLVIAQRADLARR
jgi:hypothetical protein